MLTIFQLSELFNRLRNQQNPSGFGLKEEQACAEMQHLTVVKCLRNHFKSVDSVAEFVGITLIA